MHIMQKSLSRYRCDFQTETCSCFASILVLSNFLVKCSHIQFHSW